MLTSQESEACGVHPAAHNLTSGLWTWWKVTSKTDRVEICPYLLSYFENKENKIFNQRDIILK